jgi:hypothetical protein
MPIVPFIGLSILVHVLIILLYKISSHTIKHPENTGLPKIYKRWHSFLVISLVLIFVFTNAVLLLRACLIDRHSYLHKIFSYSQTHQIQTVSDYYNLVFLKN